MKRKKTKADEVSEAVSKFPTKNKEGFTDNEIKQLCEMFKIEEKKLNTALGTNTVIMIDGEIITYHSDVEMALICCVEHRDMNALEWD